MPPKHCNISHNKWDPQNQPGIPDVVKNVHKKLKVNESLTIQEREFLIDLIKECEESVPIQQAQKNVEEEESQVVGSFSKNREIQTDNEVNETEETIKDSEDLKRIMEKMKGMLSGTCNTDEIKRLMDITYPDRRMYIHQFNPEVKELMLMYPLLFSTSEIMNELDRIYTVGKCTAFYANLIKYAPFILQEVDNENEIYVIFQHTRDSCSSELEQKYAQQVAAILLLSTVFKEKTAFMHFKDEVGQHGKLPYIDASAYTFEDAFKNTVQYKIIVEKHSVCTTTNLPDAILCLLSCYYIFDVLFDDDCNSTLFAIECLLLNLTKMWKDEEIPENVTRFVSRVLENYGDGDSAMELL